MAETKQYYGCQHKRTNGSAENAANQQQLGQQEEATLA
jgi:hypothetical protein